jgi:subtilisin family serine protease
MVSGPLNEFTRISLAARIVLVALAAAVALSGFASDTAAPRAYAQEETSPTGDTLIPDDPLSSDASTPEEPAAPADSEPAEAAPPPSGTEVIVVLDKGEDPLAVARELGVEPTHVYSEVFTGFAATMPADSLAQAQSSEMVRRISLDGRVQAEAQTVPTGVTRVGVPHIPGSQNLNISSPIDADIAILDTGVAQRGDLNVAGGVSCVDGPSVQSKKKKKGEKGKKGKKKGNKGKKKGKKGKQNRGKGKKNRKQGAESLGEKEGGKVKNKQGKGKKHNGNKNKGKNKGKNKKGKNKKGKPNKGANNRTGQRNQGPAWNDDNGHGTHTAGIAAAWDNTEGVVGVAPGARIWAVKVLDASGGGSFSSVICGLDWVLANQHMIDVVNLSLSGPGSQDSNPPFRTAIANVVNAGIPVVVAAGNQGTDAATRVPASFDEVITVSGLADSDGQPGRLGGQTCFGHFDDTFLSFSNFGADIDIMAPGDCILSLQPEGDPVRESGTSESAPHVAGAAAHFISRQIITTGARPSADQTKQWLLTEASRSQADDGVLGDPDGIPEPVLWLQNVLP